MLGISRTSTDQEIKSAYRKLALQYHPDRNPDNPDAEERFKECSEAYAILADSEKRARYDRFGHAGVSTGPARLRRIRRTYQISRTSSATCSDLATCSVSSEADAASRAQRGADLREDLTLEFEEAVFGVTKQVQVRRMEECEQCKGSGVAPGKSPINCTTCGGRGQVRYQQGFFAISRTCSTCQGSGKLIVDPCNQCRGQGRITRERTVTVKVPAGVEEGARILYSGEGEAGLYGGPSGDLYVVLHAKEHPFFEREGKNLYCVVPISFPQAALGTEIQRAHPRWRVHVEGPRRHADGNDLQGQGQRRAGAEWPWPRRSAHRGEGADPGEAQPAAARTAGGAAHHDLGGEQACQPLAAEQGERDFQ